MKDWHGNIIKILKEYGNDLRANGKVNKVLTGGKPIFITHTDNMISPLEYDPDVYYIYKKNKIKVFEVIETQSKAKTYADVVRCFIEPNITDLFFIVKTAKQYKVVANESDIILKKLKERFIVKSKGKKHSKYISNFEIEADKDFFIRVIKVTPSNVKKGYMAKKLKEEGV